MGKFYSIVAGFRPEQLFTESLEDRLFLINKLTY